MHIDFPYMVRDVDRHGNVRLYIRRNGRKIRIRQALGTEAFAAAYGDAMRALEDTKPPPVSGAAAGTFGWLAASYFASAQFRGLDPTSRRRRRAIIEDCLRELRKPGSADKMRDCPVSLLSAAHVKMLRDRKEATPGAANNRRKYLSALFGWAIEAGLMRSNPARDVKRKAYATGGFHTWSVDEVRQFEQRHPVGTKARLALALLLYLGVRRGDLVGLGRQHCDGDWIRIVPRKTRHLRKDASEKPVLPVLAEVIARSPTGGMTFLVTEYGRAFSAAGFGAWFRARCDEAGLPHCTAHGLRKAGATIAAEAGATDRQLMALYDWTSARLADVYTAKADKKRLAGEAARLIGQTMNAEVSHQSVPPNGSQTKAAG
ncbi:MAG TPA: tyrosine-type recombinase/integrase [Xanthobacteraceae bacterium]|nr:tyrosine-type recombinase/integrase [Xanthobacteraceae bacterium]